MIRGTLRPLPQGEASCAACGSPGFYDARQLRQERRNARAASSPTTFEHHLRQRRRSSTSRPPRIRRPRLKTRPDGQGLVGLGDAEDAARAGKALLRFDHFEPETSTPARSASGPIVGVSYWFPHQGNVSTALLFDYDNATFKTSHRRRPTQTKIAVHALVNF